MLCILAAFWLLSRPCRKARQSLGRGKFVESSRCWSKAPRWNTTKTEQSRVWAEWAWMEKYRNTRRFSMRWISLSSWKMTSRNHRELDYFEMIICSESGQNRGDDFQSCCSVGSTPLCWSCFCLIFSNVTSRWWVHHTNCLLFFFLFGATFGFHPSIARGNKKNPGRNWALLVCPSLRACMDYSFLNSDVWMPVK